MMRSVLELKVDEEFITPWYSRSPGVRAIARKIDMITGTEGQVVLQVIGDLVSGFADGQPGDGFMWFPLLEWQYVVPTT